MKNGFSVTTLTCLSNGFPTPNITWYQEEEKVAVSASLVIPYANFDKVIASTFCEVENDVGKLTSHRVSKKPCKSLLCV